METAIYQAYVRILTRELRPATGCTEPIAIAYAAAMARNTLGAVPDEIQAHCSGNIIKNVYGVTVPNSGGGRGVEIAAALGAVAGNADRELEVLARVSPEDLDRARGMVRRGKCSCLLAENAPPLYIRIEARAGADRCEVELEGGHTQIRRITRNGTVLQEHPASQDPLQADKALLSLAGIYEFANVLRAEDVCAVLDRQIACNTQIASEGLAHPYGACVGRTLMQEYDAKDIHIRATAMAAAGSDARMSGCPMPVVINSGSGNQGMAVSLPVIAYADELNATREQTYRALALANLIALLQKRYIGNLSAFCGAVCAAVGAVCGIAFLHGADEAILGKVINNTLCNVGGIVCDGAKPSCAAKIAAAVNAGLLGWAIAQRSGYAFGAGQGIASDDAEQTIANVGRMGRDGMRQTDTEILHIMLEQKRENCS